MALTTNLPSDVATLQTLLQDSEERNRRKDDRIEQLEKLVADCKRALFGSKSEKVSTDQYELALEDIEAAIAAIQTEGEQDVSPLTAPQKNHGVPNADHCLNIYRASKRLLHQTASSVTAAANVTLLAKMSPSVWTSCHRSFVCWSRAAPSRRVVRVRMGLPKPLQSHT